PVGAAAPGRPHFPRMDAAIGPLHCAALSQSILSKEARAPVRTGVVRSRGGWYGDRHAAAFEEAVLARVGRQPRERAARPLDVAGSGPLPRSSAVHQAI